MSAPSKCIDCGVSLSMNPGSERCDRCLIHLAETAGASRPALNAAQWEENILCELRKLRSSEERSIFLSMVCEGDDELRLRLQAKLPPNDGPVSETQPDHVGPYRILQKIGEGGFGVVYMAEQETPVRRRVALKVIKPGLDDRQVIARFEAERQALAMMDHPNIARVFDAGATETGRPFCAMELVRGIPITDYCDRNKVPPVKRLELFLDVCRAVQHAHQKGIIHRDLKPSNVLVTIDGEDPVPKVIDFGIAKAIEHKLTDRTLFTRIETLLGTPAYMSPEQAEMSSLDVDTRSDIYSLGVLLYELLTGTTPLEKRTLQEAGFDHMRKMIREYDPPRPSLRLQTMGAKAAEVATHRCADLTELTKFLRGDLDWIVMKALEKDRTRRYETANGLAADIQRHLKNEPVLAGPPGAAYRIRKFFRRNRVAVTAGTLVIISLVVGLTASIVAMRIALKEKNLTAAAKSEAETQARNATERLAEKRDLLVDLFTRSGLAAIESGNDSDALVWFAGAAEHAIPDSQQSWANQARLASCTARLPTPVLGIQAPFRPDALRFHPNGRFLMIAALPDDSRKSSEVAAILNLETGEILPFGLSGQRAAAILNTEGSELLVAYTDGKVEVLSFPSLVRKEDFSLPGGAHTVAFSRNNQNIAAGGRDFIVIRNRPRAEMHMWRSDPPGRVTSLAFENTGKLLMAGIDKSRAVVFSVPINPGQTIKPLFEPVAHFSPWPPLCWDRTDPPTLITQASEDSLHLSDIQSGRFLTDIQSNSIRYFTLFPNGTLWLGAFRIAIGYPSSTIFEKEPEDRGFTGSLHHDNDVNMLDLCPDHAGRLVTASSEGAAKVWGGPDNKVMTIPHHGDVISCSASPVAGYFATGQSDGVVRLWQDDRPASTTRIAIDSRQGGRAVVSHDGKYVTVAGSAGGPRTRTDGRILALRDGQPVGQSLPAPGLINGAAFSTHSGEIVYVGSAKAEETPDHQGEWADNPGYIAGWDWNNGLPTFESVRTNSEPVDAAWHPRSPLLAVGCAGGELFFLTRANGSMQKVEKPPSVDPASFRDQPRRWIRFSPGGRFLIQLGHRTLAVWESGEQKLLWTRTFQATVEDFVISSDEQSIAVAARDPRPSVQIFETATGKPQGSPLDHLNRVFSVDFDPTGEWLITGSQDRMVRLWNAKSRKVVRVFESPNDVLDVKFFGNGNWIIAGLIRGSLRIWNAHSPLAVIPEIFVDGGLPRIVDISSGGSAAVISGGLASVHLLDLSPFTAKYLQRYEPWQTTRAEIISGKHLIGSTLQPLGTEEWLEKWRALNNEPLHRPFRRN